MASMPTSCCTSRDRAWLLMRAEARGLSGILIASTPTDFRKRAPSTSLRTSIPLGGTISTMVRNSPAAILAPSLDRFSSGTAGVALTTSLGVLDGLVLARASLARSADFMGWVLRYRERVGVGGKIKTVQRAKRLAPVDAQHKT